jgi:hypothetical protein
MGASGDPALLRQIATQQAGYEAEQAQGLAPEQLGALGVAPVQQGAFKDTSLEKQKLLLDQQAKKEQQKFQLQLFNAKEAGKTEKLAEKDIPQAQANAAGFYQMMAPASQQIDSIVDNSPDIIARLSGPQLLQAINAPNSIKDQVSKQYATAMRAFINSQLRKESGAAISETEYEGAKDQYIPQAGDSAERLAQKRQNRIIAMAGMKAAAGKRAIGAVEKEYQTLSKENAGSMNKKKQAAVNSRIDLVKDADIQAALKAKMQSYIDANEEIPEVFINRVNALSVGE